MSKVYVVNRPVKNKFNWTPDLTDATRYGALEIIFEPDDKPQFIPVPMIQKARGMIVCMIAAELAPTVRVLRWERNMEEGSRDRRKGWYMPVALELRKEKNEEYQSA